LLVAGACNRLDLPLMELLVACFHLLRFIRGFESFPGALPETLSAPVLISPQVAYFRYSSYRALPDLNYRGGAQKHSNIGTSIRMPDIRSK